MEAAYRYLVRSYEIISETHGPFHPSSGTACLAVASVLGVTGSHGESREWLVRALKCFEKVEPRPVRAIAFTQQQLSTVLSKEGHTDESMRVLDKAANFHLGKAREGLAAHTKANLGAYVFTPVLKGSALHEDVVMAMNMTAKISRLISKNGGKWQAAEQSEIVAELADAAFGWDSVAAGEAFKEMEIATLQLKTGKEPLRPSSVLSMPSRRQRELMIRKLSCARGAFSRLRITRRKA